MRLALPKPYHLRDAVSEDAEPLFVIHRSAMHDYVARIWGWDEAWQKQDFTKDFHPPTNRQVICASNVPIGFVCLDTSSHSIDIGSIELHADYQGRGIGSAIFHQLIQQSEDSGTPLRLQVFKINNRAHALYEGLGFKVIGETEHHLQMERTPASATTR